MIALSEGVRAALECRLKYGITLDMPCDIYDLIARQGVDLRFIDVSSLEGLYLVEGEFAQINVCGLRPSGLQHFIAAHELGHHTFGHGATIDQESDFRQFHSHPQEEALVEVFARFLLMPPRAVRMGFKNIGSVLGHLQAEDVFRVSSWLGVGYSTLLNQMRFSLKILSKTDFDRLTKVRPQQIKTLLDPEHPRYGHEDLWPAHHSWNGLRVHARIGDIFTGLANCVTPIVSQNTKSTFCATAVGETTCELKGGGRLTVSVARNPYIGLYKYRYLEEAE